jgi:hypothetical protein
MNKRITTHAAVLTNAHTNPPNIGEQVLALTIGGKLVETTWKSDSLRYFDAWCGYPTIPDDVKALQSDRYTQPRSDTITMREVLEDSAIEEKQKHFFASIEAPISRKNSVDWRFPR